MTKGFKRSLNCYSNLAITEETSGFSFGHGNVNMRSSNTELNLDNFSHQG